VGCGTGYVVAGTNLDFKKYTGMDAFAEAEEYLRKNLGLSVQFTTRTLKDLPEGHFDTVLLLDVLEHIQDDSGFLDAVSSVMNKGSRIIISVPAHQWLFSSADVASGHVRRYSVKSFMKLCEKSKFKIIFCSSFLNITLPLLAISRIFLSDERGGQDQHTGTVNHLLKLINPLDFIFFRYIKLPFGGSLVMVLERDS